MHCDCPAGVLHSVVSGGSGAWHRDSSEEAECSASKCPTSNFAPKRRADGRYGRRLSAAARSSSLRPRHDHTTTAHAEASTRSVQAEDNSGDCWYTCVLALRTALDSSVAATADPRSAAIRTDRLSRRWADRDPKLDNHRARENTDKPRYGFGNAGSDLKVVRQQRLTAVDCQPHFSLAHCR